MQPTDLDELKTEATLAIAKGLRIGHYALQAHDEIALLRYRLAMKDIAGHKSQYGGDGGLSEGVLVPLKDLLT